MNTSLSCVAVSVLLCVQMVKGNFLRHKYKLRRVAICTAICVRAFFANVLKRVRFFRLLKVKQRRDTTSPCQIGLS